MIVFRSQMEREQSTLFTQALTVAALQFSVYGYITKETYLEVDLDFP